MCSLLFIIFSRYRGGGGGELEFKMLYISIDKLYDFSTTVLIDDDEKHGIMLVTKKNDPKFNFLILHIYNFKFTTNLFQIQVYSVSMLVIMVGWLCWFCLGCYEKYIMWLPCSYLYSNIRTNKVGLRRTDGIVSKQYQHTAPKYLEHILEIFLGNIWRLPKYFETSHVGKYDRADDRPKLAMLAANVGYRYWTDDRSRLGW